MEKLTRFSRIIEKIKTKNMAKSFIKPTEHSKFRKTHQWCRKRQSAKFYQKEVYNFWAWYMMTYSRNIYIYIYIWLIASNVIHLRNKKPSIFHQHPGCRFCFLHGTLFHLKGVQQHTDICVVLQSTESPSGLAGIRND